MSFDVPPGGQRFAEGEIRKEGAGAGARADPTRGCRSEIKQLGYLQHVGLSAKRGVLNMHMHLQHGKVTAELINTRCWV